MSDAKEEESLIEDTFQVIVDQCHGPGNLIIMVYPYMLHVEKTYQLPTDQSKDAFPQRRGSDIKPKFQNTLEEIRQSKAFQDQETRSNGSHVVQLAQLFFACRTQTFQLRANEQRMGEARQKARIVREEQAQKAQIHYEEQEQKARHQRELARETNRSAERILELQIDREIEKDLAEGERRNHEVFETLVAELARADPGK